MPGSGGHFGRTALRITLRFCSRYREFPTTQRSSASCKSFKVVYGPFFHGGNTGSNPVGDANNLQGLSAPAPGAVFVGNETVTIAARVLRHTYLCAASLLVREGRVVWVRPVNRGG